MRTALLGLLAIMAHAQTPEEVAGTSIFIYPENSAPCKAPSPLRLPSPENAPPLPMGSGFVIFLDSEKKEPVRGELGFRFLVTAAHVVGNTSSIVLRLNRTDKKGYTCQSLTLVRTGSLPARNVHTLIQQPQVDLVAVRMPDIPNADPTSFGYSMILDRSRLAENQVRMGTDVFTVGYLFGYAGLYQNFPVTKFGKVAMITDEYWLGPDPNTGRKELEEGYIVELQNVPGLSGAPVMLLSPQFLITPDTHALQFRITAPLIFGVIKEGLGSPVGGSQGVAVVEPGYRLRELMQSIADEYRAAGATIKLD